MKYKCLVLDHDDTVVDSTAEIHFPSFVEYLKITRPHLVSEWDLETYFVKNFHPGITSILRDELGMDEAEMQEEMDFWANYVEGHIPTAYEGMADIIAEFRSRGGIVAVDSHSLLRYIERDYRHNSLPMPDVIYAWDLPEEQRKPSPYTLFDLTPDGEGGGGGCCYAVFIDGQIGQHSGGIHLGQQRGEGQLCQLLGGENITGLQDPLT